MNAVDELNLRLGIGPPRPRLPITLQRSGYSAVRQLGKGSFGNAYLVFHAGRKQLYVVKHVNMANMTSRQRRDAHQEIVVLQQLQYPNIIRYVEFCEEHPHLYIVMEYADGGDVYTHLKNLKSSVWALGGGGIGGGGSSGGLTEEQVISLFVQTTMAVKYMHDRRLLHRDIKSQNVFLTKNHVVKLGDFGISTVLMSTVAMAQTMCGTPCYFSPELCEGKPYNNKSDVWALGVLLYELCTTGRLPFEATTMNRLMDDICRKEPRRIPASFSDELWELVLWMLKKDPRQRPDAGQILRSPVLLRAIPNIIKKLSATDGRSEDEYRRVLSGGATPPPPICPAMELHPKIGKDYGGNAPLPSGGSAEIASAAAAAAAAAPLGGARKRSNESPFIRGNAYDVAKDRVGGVLRDLTKQRQQLRQLQQQREDEEALKRALPTNQPIIGDAFGYIPALLRGKQNYNQNEGNVDDKGKANNNNEGSGRNDDIRNYNALGRNMPSKEDNVFAQDNPHPLAGGGNKNEKKEPNPSSVGANAAGEPQRKPVNNLPLHDLFLIYDENKKRIINEREQHGRAMRKPMNYQPAGVRPFRGRPAVAEANADGREPNQKIPSALPHHLIYDNVKALPHVIPNTENQFIPAPSVVAPDAAEAARRPPPLTSLEDQHQPSNRTEARNDTEDNDDDTPAANEPKGDLAFVLQEMTHHLESVLSSAVLTDNNCETSGVKGTPWANSSTTTSSAGVDPTAISPCPTTELNPDEVRQEFLDAMGTTLNVEDLQRPLNRTPISSEGVNCFAEGDHISLCISRYDAVWPPPGAPVTPAGIAVSPVRGGEKNEEVNARPFCDMYSPKLGGSSSPRNLTADAAVVQGVGAASASGAAVEGEGEREEAPLFTGGCLCDGVCFTGLASTIFGSFVCNCVVCSRFSGSMMGVEWLHLPDMTFEGFFTEASPANLSVPPPPQRPQVIPAEEIPAGAGISAAQALTKANPSSTLKNDAATADNADTAEGGGGSSDTGRVNLPQPLRKFTLEVPMVDEDGVEGMGVYAVYFCGRCGSTIGMDHSDIAGCIIAKAVLSDASLATLESFQQTMPLGTDEALLPRKA
ncbi:protein kinase [Trypanosoma rangeli SC58]|uniref:non-specific serine/threonine protein kinase n=1 Tax=Trypanosoma rangeli SC58 TaxID=429131 RepID=A0A061J7C9_TRYRA|nr:protein kinase [Trypanosoma rangeli SC58]